MGDALKLIIKRAERGLMYGANMPSSRATILQDIAELADWEKCMDGQVFRYFFGTGAR